MSALFFVSILLQTICKKCGFGPRRLRPDDELVCLFRYLDSDELGITLVLQGSDAKQKIILISVWKV